MAIKYKSNWEFHAVIRVLVKTPPFSTLEGMEVKPLLGGFYEVKVKIKEKKMPVLKKRAEKIEHLLKEGLM